MRRECAIVRPFQNIVAIETVKEIVFTKFLFVRLRINYATNNYFRNQGIYFFVTFTVTSAIFANFYFRRTNPNNQYNRLIFVLKVLLMFIFRYPYQFHGKW